MPWQAPGSLDEESYARIVAYLLKKMSADADSAAGIDGSVGPRSDSTVFEDPLRGIDENNSIHGLPDSKLERSDGEAPSISDLTPAVLVIIAVSILVPVLEAAVFQKRN